MIKFLLVLGLAVLAYLYLTGQLTRAAKRRSMTAEEARAVLGVPLGADADAIRAAHRRLVARVHPDAGGSAELATRVNLARDTLLSELNRNVGGAS